MTQKTINVILALGLAAALVFAGLAVRTTPAQVQGPGQSFGAANQVQSLPVWFLNGFKMGDVNQNWFPNKTINLGETQTLVYTNNTGKNLIVDYGEIELAATPGGVRMASSTYNVILFATTTTSVPSTQDFTAVSATSTGLVIGTWATSTVATTSTNSLTGQNSIFVPNGWSLIAYFNRTGNCSNGSCETATSSNRGFIAKIRSRYHFDD